MAWWPYEFITLNDEEKHLRRESLAYHAAIAHYSLIAPLAALLLLKLVRIGVSRVYPGVGGGGGGAYQRVPSSPTIKAHRDGVAAGLLVRWNKLVWWVSDDVLVFGQVWGQRDQWIFGSVWMLWLLTLSVVGTGKDYLHLTKRFGIIAVSQFPLHYLLALKAINPLSFALATSHERVNRYHRVLGRVVYLLLLLHIAFYNYFFLHAGIWTSRFFAPVVFAGVVASFALHALNATAARVVRRWSYRVFFVTHLVAALAVPPLIFFHAPSVRLYVVEAAGIFAVDLAVRKTTAVTAPASLEAVPGTDLIKLSVPLPPKKARQYLNRPASHVYLSVPPENRPASPANFIFDFLYNPFTVASVNESSNAISLVFRRQIGPMTTHLGNLAASSSSSSSSPDSETKLPLTIEGPYGAASLSFPDLLAKGGGAHRILLFAGGVGATFALPIYNALIAERPTSKVKFIWAIRAAADATWAVSLTSSEGGKSLLDDDKVQLFLTGDMGSGSGPSPSASHSYEMSDLRRRNAKRPDITKIVDDTFRLGQNETVAIMVCGPAEMVRDVRQAVRPWVMKGRNVWWHDEAFGW